MPQISLYIDESTLEKVECAAKKENISISKWVAQQIRTKIEPEYPVGFEDLFGSIGDASFVTPERVGFAKDLKRESL